MMKEWMPIPGTNKDQLIMKALEEFKQHGYKNTNITELAKKADMTTGAVYHHFGSKAKLYEVIRTDIEQRIIDRMEGAASLFSDPERAMEAALITGLDFAAKQDLCRLVSEEYPYKKRDRIEAFLEELNTDGGLPLHLILGACWRSVLSAMGDGGITLEQGKKLIKWSFQKES
ncbi:TetR/AcrR family transcriptional regulator [Peribacillus sp. SCS-26]|uniref:TetR/AcrR family transcriptional regulator n=1 Tax=Paraperibacillus marinus TaxID=3115295 RepID=UPI003905D3B3